MDRRQKVTVFARVAPQRGGTSPPCVDGADGKTVELRKDDSTRAYSLDGVFGSTTTQAEVYARVGADLVDDVLNGFHACALAYGQTGTGKTWTIAGPRLSQQATRAVLSGGAPSATSAAIDESDGLLPRMLVDLLKARDAARAAGRTMTLHLAYLQLYCEELQDLLVGTQLAAAAAASAVAFAAVDAPPLVIREHPRRGVYVQGLSWHAIGSLADAIRLLDHGAARRAVAATRMNAHSSRSHAVVMIRVQQQQQQAPPPRGAPASVSDAADGASAPAGAGTISATLTVVDLAGSERAKKSLGYGARDAVTAPSTGVQAANAAGDAAAVTLGAASATSGGADDASPPLVNIDQLAHEMRAINVSLTALGNVIAALAARSDAAGAAGRARSADPTARGAGAASASAAAAMPSVHVPYRNSVLTRLLQNCLGGNARTSLVVTVSPDPASAGETQSTLEFASRASRVRITARRAEGDASPSGGCARHRKQIAQLRKAVDELQAEVAELHAQLRAMQAGKASIASPSAAALPAEAACRVVGAPVPRTDAAASMPTASIIAAHTSDERPGSASTDDGGANDVIIDGDSDSDGGDDFEDAPADGRAAARQARAAHQEAARLRVANAALELRLAGALASASREQEHSSSVSALHASLAQSMRHLAASFTASSDCSSWSAASVDAPRGAPLAPTDGETLTTACAGDLCATIDDEGLRVAAAGLPPQLALALIEAHKAWQRQLLDVDGRARAQVAAAEARAAAMAATAREQIAAAEADRDTARDELLDVLQQFRQSRTTLRVLQKDSLVQIAEAVETIEATRLRLERAQAQRDDLAARCSTLETELRAAKTQLQAAAAAAASSSSTRVVAADDDADARAAVHELHKMYAARMEMITERVKFLEREREKAVISSAAGGTAHVDALSGAAVAGGGGGGGDRWSQALDAAAAAHATVTTRLKRASSETESTPRVPLASGPAAAAAAAMVVAGPRVLARAASSSEVVGAAAAAGAVAAIPPLRVSTAAAATRSGATSARVSAITGGGGGRASMSAASTPMGAAGGGFAVAAGALPTSADMLTANLARLRQLPPVLSARQPAAGGGRGGASAAAAGLVRASR